jgi:hypothetical protein
MNTINETKLVMSEISGGLSGIDMGNYLVYTFVVFGILLMLLVLAIIKNALTWGHK